MNTSSDPNIESLLKKQVLDVSTLAKTGEYSKALSTMRKAKAIHPKNIFIIALEKQMEKLLALSQSSPLSDPERLKELLDSLPGLIERAVEGMNNEEPLPPSAAHPLAEREVAFAKLKDEYFQLADGYLMKGEYNEALREIKRVLILEPDSAAAKEYQIKIQELLLLKEKPRMRNSGISDEKPRPEMQPTRRLQEKVPERNPPVNRVTPQIGDTGNSKARSKGHSRASRSRNLTIGVIPIFVVLLIATYFFTRQEQNPVAGPSSASNTVGTNAKGGSSPATVPVQPVQRKQDIQSAPATIEGQSLTDSISKDAKPSAIRKDTIATEKLTGESIADGSIPETALETKPVVEPSKREKVPKEILPEEPKNKTAKGDPKVHESKAEASNAMQLTKLEVKRRSPGTLSKIETPATVEPVERKAQIIHLVNPKFPEAAQRTGLQGEVLVGVQVGPDGKPIQAKILRSSSAVFNSAVIEAVMRSTYSPGVMSSGPVTSWITFPFSFKINRKN